MSDNERDALDAPLANKLARSAVDVQPLALKQYRNQEVSMSTEPFADLEFSLWDVQSSRVKAVNAFMRALEVCYDNEMTAVMYPAESDTTDYSKGSAIAVEIDRKSHEGLIKDDVTGWESQLLRCASAQAW